MNDMRKENNSANPSIGENIPENNTDFIHMRISDAGLENLLKYIRKDGLHNKNRLRNTNNIKTETNDSHKGNTAPVLEHGHSNGQFHTMLLLLILLFSGLSMWLVKTNAMENDHSNSDLQVGIAEDIIRFHVIANSDSQDDQALKLIVKETLVSNLSPVLRNVDTLSQARDILTDQLTNIQELAETTLLENGYSYPVTVSLGDSYFPLKVYGDYSFPPGTYEALRVQIGAAKGKNWWCVMFPPLCFVDETYSVVDESSQEKLKHLLTEAEYDTLVSQKAPVKIKFKLIETLKDLFH